MSNSIPQKEQMKLTKTSNTRIHPYTNRVYLNPENMQRLGLNEDDPVVLESMLVVQARVDPKIPVNHIGSSGLQWSALHFKQAVGKIVTIENWKYSKLNKNIQASALVYVYMIYDNIFFVQYIYTSYISVILRFVIIYIYIYTILIYYI